MVAARAGFCIAHRGVADSMMACAAGDRIGKGEPWISVWSEAVPESLRGVLMVSYFHSRGGECLKRWARTRLETLLPSAPYSEEVRFYRDLWAWASGRPADGT